MRPMRVFGVIAPMLLGFAAAAWTPLAFWADMKEGLIAFLGFLAASLVQVMPLTANFLQSDKLSVQEADRLTDSLTKQQLYWVGLLTATITALVLVIVGAALSAPVANLKPFFRHEWFWEVSWAQVVTFFMAFGVSFVLAKMLGLFQGMLSLHRLRVELVINAAKREAAEKSAAAHRETQPAAPRLPEGYGAVVRPHH